MTRSPARTEAVSRDEYRAYLVKATEFVGTAHRALEDQRLNSASLEAIHAVVSACDALTIFRMELRCRGQDHRDVLALLGRIPDTGVHDLRRQVSEVLSVKNRVEYGGSGLSSPQTERIVLQAKRVVRWVSEHVGP